MNLSDLFFMHGYGLYVWPAYTITLLVFGINIFNTVNEKRQTTKRIKHYLAANKLYE